MSPQSHQPKSPTAPRLGTARAILLATLVALISQYAAAQDTPPKISPLQRAVNERIKEQRYDEALDLAKNAAAEPSPPADAPQVLFTTATYFRANGRHAQALDLFKEITERFPNSFVTPFAWCGMGQAYGTLGENEKMIAAIEHGLSLPRVPPPTPFFDLGDTVGFAFRTLGNHYVANRQWQQALRIFTDWKPTSWCGTCLGGMQESRTNAILLCHAHLSEFSRLTELSWREVARGNQTNEQLELFLLVRLYAEAGQLDSLRLMVAMLEDRASQKYPAELSEANVHRLNTIRKTTSALSIAIDNVTHKDAPHHIQAIESESSLPVVKHVARWSLLRNPKHSVPALKAAAALKAHSGSSKFPELLAAIDTLGSRTALVDLACTRDPYQMQAVCRAIHHLKDRNELLTKVSARVPKENAHLIHLGSELEPFAPEYRYYETWNIPKSKSLLTSLPEKLFDD